MLVLIWTGFLFIMKINVYGLLILIFGAIICFFSEGISGIFLKKKDEKSTKISLIVKGAGILIAIIGVLVTLEIF